MTTITEKEFINLIKAPSKWDFKSDKYDSIGYDTVTNQQLSPNGGDVIETTVTTCYMWGWVTATHGEIEITYQEAASWYDDDPADFKTTIDHGGEVIRVRGVTVLDEYGDQYTRSELIDLAWENADQAFFRIDWKSLLP